jgi:hypothetical protein
MSREGTGDGSFFLIAQKAKKVEGGYYEEVSREDPRSDILDRLRSRYGDGAGF